MKNKKSEYIILGIMFVLFNVITFSIPTNKTLTFWIAYFFVFIAFIVQIVLLNMTHHKTNTLKSKFLGLPIIYVGVAYLIIQLVSFVFFLIFPYIANWIPIITGTMITGISGIFLVTTEAGKEGITRIEEKIQEKTLLIKNIQVEIELMAEQQTDALVKETLNELANKVRYSDPMSDDSLSSIENEIVVNVNKLKDIPVTDIVPVAKEIEVLLLKRNKKAKLLK